MKKNNNRKPKPRASQPKAPASGVIQRLGAPHPDHAAGAHETQLSHERKVGVVSGTPADSFDEAAERKHNKWIAIYISVLAVLLAIAATGSNDAMKTAQQAGIGVVDTYSFYQAKTIRQSSIKLAVDELDLKAAETANTPNLPENAKKLIETNKAAYQTEISRLESNGRNGKKELLAKAERCDNDRKVALAQHPFYDYSMAMFQIAIVLASASIVAGTRLLLLASGLVGVFAVLLFLNGYSLVFGFPELKHERADELAKNGVKIALTCIEE